MKDALSPEEMVRLCKEHTLFTWSRQDAVNPLPIERAEGVYFWDTNGKRYLDFNSLLMSVNIGHHHPYVREAIKRQADELVFAHPQHATQVRARLAKLLADNTPEPIQTFLFTLGGSDANENAIRAAKFVTGRQKVLVRHRAYHGASNLAINLTGDFRRWPNEPSIPGIVRVMDPVPYTYSFGEEAEEQARQNLLYLEEVLMYENPKSFAAILVETVTGTNGVLPPTKSYMQGLRRLCDEHDIMLICDEVMAGFGRTGKFYAFEHYDIVPDLVTMAKGLTSSYMPLGCVGMSRKVAEFFQDHTFVGGLTYNSHPMSLAAAEANIEVLLNEKLIENAAKLESVMREEMARLKTKHPSMKAGRAIGLMGMIDLQKNSKGELLSPYGTTNEASGKLAKAFLQHGLFTYVRWSGFSCMPPLCITEAQLREGFAIIDECLAVTDAYFEG